MSSVVPVMSMSSPPTLVEHDVVNRHVAADDRLGGIVVVVDVVGVDKSRRKGNAVAGRVADVHVVNVRIAGAGRRREDVPPHPPSMSKLATSFVSASCTAPVQTGRAQDDRPIAGLRPRRRLGNDDRSFFLRR